MRSAGPVRRCAGCRARDLRERMLRFATVEGAVVPDPDATAPGRGAWLHPTVSCWEAAVSRRGFHRAFRAPVTIPERTVDFISTWPKSASTS